MTDVYNVWADVLVAALISLFAACVVLMVAGLAKAASREMPAPPESPPPAMPPTLAAHIARHAVAELDAEWERICKATGGPA